MGSRKAKKRVNAPKKRVANSPKKRAKKLAKKRVANSPTKRAKATKRAKLSKAEFLRRMAAGKRKAAKGKRKNTAKPTCKRRNSAPAKHRGAAKRRPSAAELRKAVSKSAKAKRNGGRKVRRNSAMEEAADRYEFFHGKGPETVTEVTAKVRERDVFSGIGKLKKLFIITDEDFELEYAGFGDALLAQDVGGGQLYIIGGNQRMNLADFDLDDDGRQYYALGALHRVHYDTEKTHLPPESGGKAVYDHEFGENGGRLPIVIYDALNEQLILAGGSYTLPSVGIDD